MFLSTDTNGFIISPKTNKPVRKGTRTWMMLLKEGLIENDYKDDNILDTLSDKEEDEIKQKIDIINEKLTKSSIVQAVRGRGKYKNHIVKRNKPITANDMRKYTTKVASKVIKQNKEELEEESDSDKLEDALEKMILDEMMSKRKVKKQPTKKAKFYTKDISDDSDDSEDIDE